MISISDWVLFSIEIHVTVLNAGEGASRPKTPSRHIEEESASEEEAARMIGTP
jgi:hypothetical protein